MRAAAIHVIIQITPPENIPEDVMIDNFIFVVWPL